MWVVDVEADGAEQILHPGVVSVDPINEILVPTSNHHLAEQQQQQSSLQTEGLGYALSMLVSGSLSKLTRYFTDLH